MARPFAGSATSLRSLATLVLCALFAGAWFGIGGRPLLNPDEGRYAEIPREMIVNNDWVTPRLNDLKYLEKPPLQYWATALAYEAFGVNAFTSRLWCEVTGLASIALVGWMGIRLFNRRVGLIAAALLAGSWLQGVFGHLNTLDMGLSFFLNASLAAFLFAQSAKMGSRAERNWMLAAWTMAALAFLSKGLIAVVLPGLTLVLYSLVARSGSVWKRLHAIPGIAIFLALVAPWLIAVSIANREFLQFFFYQEHLQRFLTHSHARVQPWWFFLPIILVGALPWATLVIPSFRSVWRERLAIRARSSGVNVSLFLALWICVVLLFFSFSHSKLPPYILPVMPALALITAKYATELSPRRLLPHIGGTAALLGLLIAVGFIVAPPRNEHIALSDSVRAIAAAQESIGLALIGAIVGLWFAYRRRATAALIAVSAGSFVCVSALVVAAGGVGEFRSGYELASVVERYIDAQRPIYSLHGYDQALTFYIRRPVKLVAYRGELDFGLRQEPHKWVSNEAAFIAAWKNDSPGSIALLPRDAFDRLSADRVPMTSVGGNGEIVVVIRPDSKSE